MGRLTSIISGILIFIAISNHLNTQEFGWPLSRLEKTPEQAINSPFIQPMHNDQYLILTPARLSEDSRTIIGWVQGFFQHIITRGEIPDGFISGPFRLSITQGLLERLRIITSTQEIRFISLDYQEMAGLNSRAEILAILIGEPNWLEIELYLELNDSNVWTIIDGNVFMREDRLGL